MSDMIIGVIVGIAIGLVAAYFLMQFLLALVMRRTEHQLESLVKSLEESISKAIPARVEEDGGVFYVYNAQDGSFLAQGRTLEELRDRISARWPDATVHVTEGETEVLERLKATLPDATA